MLIYQTLCGIPSQVQMKWKKEFEKLALVSKILGSFLFYKYPNVYVYLQKNQIALVFTN